MFRILSEGAAVLRVHSHFSAFWISLHHNFPPRLTFVASAWGRCGSCRQMDVFNSIGGLAQRHCFVHTQCFRHTASVLFSAEMVCLTQHHLIDFSLISFRKTRLTNFFALCLLSVNIGNH